MVGPHSLAVAELDALRFLELLGMARGRGGSDKLFQMSPSRKSRTSGCWSERLRQM